MLENKILPNINIYCKIQNTFIPVWSSYIYIYISVFLLKIPQNTMPISKTFIYPPMKLNSASAYNPTYAATYQCHSFCKTQCDTIRFRDLVNGVFPTIELIPHKLILRQAQANPAQSSLSNYNFFIINYLTSEDFSRHHQFPTHNQL